MKKLFCILSALLLLATLSTAVFAASPVLADTANLLTASEEESLSHRLQEVGDEYGVQISAVTVSSTDGVSVEDYADSYFDTYGYGIGEGRDGVMLMVSMDPRECYILCNGRGWDAVDSDDVEDILDVITPDLSAGRYADAFIAFAEECEHKLDVYFGNEGDGGSGFFGDADVDFVKILLIALGVGLLIGLVYALYLKGQLKSVRRQYLADAYVRAGSLNMTRFGDYYMYRNVIRTPKPQNNSSSRSGGSSRGGGGRSF